MLSGRAFYPLVAVDQELARAVVAEHPLDSRLLNRIGGVVRISPVRTADCDRSMLAYFRILKLGEPAEVIRHLLATIRVAVAEHVVTLPLCVSLAPGRGQRDVG